MGAYLIDQRHVTARAEPYTDLAAMLYRWTEQLSGCVGGQRLEPMQLQPGPGPWCGLHLPEDVLSPVTRLRAQQSLDRITGHAQARGLNDSQSVDQAGRIRVERWQSLILGLYAETKKTERTVRAAPIGPSPRGEARYSIYTDVALVQAQMIRAWADPRWTRETLDAVLGYMRTQPGIILHPFQPVRVTLHPGTWAVLFAALVMVDATCLAPMYRETRPRRLLRALGLGGRRRYTDQAGLASPLAAGLTLMRRAARGLIRRERWAGYWDQLTIGLVLAQCLSEDGRAGHASEPLDATVASVLKGLPVLAAPAFAPVLARLEQRVPRGAEILRAAATQAWTEEMPSWLAGSVYDPSTADRPRYG